MSATLGRIAGKKHQTKELHHPAGVLHVEPDYGQSKQLGMQLSFVSFVAVGLVVEH